MPGDYRLIVSRAGYAPVEYGQTRALEQGRTLTVREGSRCDRVDVAFQSGGVITGRVVDMAGEPIEGLLVEVWERRFSGGQPLVLPASAVSVRRTDDRGVYRTYGLLPGRYYLAVGDGTSAPGVAVPFFYPGRTDIAEALPIEIDASGTVVGGVDLAFAPPRTSRLTGLVVDARPAAQGIRLTSGNAVLLPAARPGVPTLTPHVARIDDGTFVFPHVMSGEYILQAVVAGVTEVTVDDRGSSVRVGYQAQFGSTHVTVAGTDIGPLTIRLSPGSMVSGRIEAEGGTGDIPPRVDLAAVPAQIGSAPIDHPARILVNRDLSFHAQELSGAVRFVAMLPDDWYLKSMMIDGIDAADEPFTFDGARYDNVEVVIAGNAASVAGRARDDRRQPVETYSVVVFPIDTRRWYAGSRYMKLTRSDGEGAFRVSGLPPGDYWIIAIDTIAGDTDHGEWLDPEVLTRLASDARRITLREGARRSDDLQVVRLDLYRSR